MVEGQNISLDFSSPRRGKTSQGLIKGLHILCASIIFIACHEDKDLSREVNEQLQGTWLIDAQYIDGKNQSYVNDSTEFVFNSQSEIAGRLIWRRVTDPSYIIFENEYDVVEKGRSILVQGHQIGDKYNLEFSGNQLDMTGWVGSHHWVYKTTRK